MHLTSRDQGRASRRHSGRSVAYRTCVAACGVLLLFASIAGCYTYVPVQAAAPAPGTEVSLAITDRGRVELAREMGSGVRRVHGRLMASTDSTIVLSVSAVEYLNSPAPIRWAGESITLDRNVLADVSERRLSRSRSWLAAGLVAAVAAGLSTLVIAGFGGDGGDTRPPGDDDDTD